MTDLSPLKTLRPYQANAIELVRSSMRKGNRRVVMQGPTGFGKTLVASKLIGMALEKGNRAIFTAPAISLIDQTVEAFQSEGLGDLGVLQSNHPMTDPSKPVQIASVQTLARRDIPPAALVIVDECHIRSEVVEQMMADRPDVFFVGLSATPWATGMGCHWNDLVIPTTISDLIAQGYLSKFRALAPDVPDLKGVRKRGGEYVEAALARIMGDAKLMGHVVQTWLEHGEARPTLCFGVNRRHAHDLMEGFERAGVSAAYVDAFTDRIERQLINRRFRAGEIRVICSVRTMTTGVDLPVSCIIDAAPTASEMLHVQKIGRGLRVNPGTEDCLILDHAGNSLRLGLVTDIHHDKLDATRPGEKRQERVKAEKLPDPCPQCGALSSARLCASCGHERKPPPSGVETVDGKLVEVTGKKKAATHEEKQRFWSMALALSQQRKRGKKLAYGLYKAKFGVWPRGLSDTLLYPDTAFMNYEKSRRIAYAKAMKKQEEHSGA